MVPTALDEYRGASTCCCLPAAAARRLDGLDGAVFPDGIPGPDLVLVFAPRTFVVADRGLSSRALFPAARRRLLATDGGRRKALRAFKPRTGDRSAVVCVAAIRTTTVQPVVGRRRHNYFPAAAAVWFWCSGPGLCPDPARVETLFANDAASSDSADGRTSYSSSACK